MNLVNESEIAKQMGQSRFGPAEIKDMKSMLDDPNVSAEQKSNILYGLSTMGKISDEEVRRYADQIGGINATDCMWGGQAPMENISNLSETYKNITEQRARQAQQQIDGAQSTLQQGGFSNSDQIIDEGAKGLRLFEEFYPYYQQAGGQPGQGGMPGQGSNTPHTPLAGGNSAGGGAGYSHSGVDPSSLRAGMDEFRGIDFTAFKADAQMLKEADRSVDQSADQLEKAWSTNTSDWTGEAKSAAQRRYNNLSEGSADLSQSLKTAPENIVTVIDEGVQQNVIDFANQVLNLYGDGTISGLTSNEVAALVSAKENLPGEIEKLEAKIREIENRGPLESFGNFITSALAVVVTGGIALGPIVGIALAENITEDNIKEETQKLKQALRETNNQLRRFCADYTKKANAVHKDARNYVQGIQENYTTLIESLTKALDPPPFKMSEGNGGKPPADQGGGGGTGTGSGGGGSTGGVPSGGGGSGGGGSGGGSTTPSTSTPKPPEGQDQPGTNPVTGKPLETDPETGEPYPIDPETGEAVKDVGEEQEQLTVRQGENEITMSEPDDKGEMEISVADGSGEPLNFKLDFQQGEEGTAGDGRPGKGGTGEGGAGEGAAQDGERQGSGPRGGSEARQDESDESEQRVYQPGPDGKIHIEKDGLDITAERPAGPDGPTLVTVDDGSGEPTTYTLGEKAEGQAGAGSPSTGTGEPSSLTGSGSGLGSLDAEADGGAEVGADADVSGDASTEQDAGTQRNQVPGAPEVGAQEEVPAADHEAGQASDAASDPVQPDPGSNDPSSAVSPDVAPVEAGAPDVDGTDEGAGEGVDQGVDEGADDSAIEGAMEGEAAQQPNQGTEAQGVFGDIFSGGDSGLAAGVAATGGDPAPLNNSMDSGGAQSQAGSADLGTAPGGGDSPSVGQHGGQSSSMSGMGMLGAGLGTADGGGDQERDSSGYGLGWDLFGTSGDGGRISGSLDDETGSEFARTGQ